jgi:predicted RNase H-like HicB family nuclease
MPDLRVRDYLARPYHRVVRRSDELWAAEVLEFPGCFASGDTDVEALENLTESMESWLESELEAGHQIPEPFGDEHYQGRVSLRITPTLHRRAAAAAVLEGVSLNRLLSSAIAVYLGEVSAADRLATRASSAVRVAAVAESSPDYRSTDASPAER